MAPREAVKEEDSLTLVLSEKLYMDLMHRREMRAGIKIRASDTETFWCWWEEKLNIRFH